MSLLDEAMENMTVINKNKVDDGYGGIKTEWEDGASFMGALVLDNYPETKIAMAMGASNIYTLTVRKDVEFDYHEVFRRESDKKIFRVTSNSDDKHTPDSASLNMRQYDVEEWSLTR